MRKPALLETPACRDPRENRVRAAGEQARALIFRRLSGGTFVAVLGGGGKRRMRVRANDLFFDDTALGRARQAARPGERPVFDLRRESHVWMVDGRDVTPAQLARYDALLDVEERDRRHGRPAGDRRMFTIIRALVRTVLSHYAPVAPKDWKFAAGPYGRPYIAGPAGAGPVGAPSLNFSVSCTGHLAFILVTTGPYAALDAERFRPMANAARTAKSYYSAPEADAVNVAAKDDAHNELFFSLWTLREAYLKARGFGTMVPLPGAIFAIDDEAIDFSLDDSMEDDAGRWSFQLLRPTPDAVVAIALSSAHALTSRLRCFRTVPLEREEALDVMIASSTHAHEHRQTIGNV
jgi:4'-phosphopantetheinyl transferase